MAKNDPVYSAFSRALRARYKTPRAALRALGLDENLILQSRRGLAFDNNPLTGEPETEAQKTMAADPGLNGSLIRKVVDFCAAHIDDGEVLNELEEMLTGIKNQIEKQFGAKMPKTDGAWRADGQIRKRQYADVASSSRHGYVRRSNRRSDQAAEPGSGEGGVGRNAIEGGMGGRLSEQEKRRAEEQRREPAMDAAAVKRLERDFPGIGRIDTTGGLPAGPRSRSTPVLGIDTAGVKELEEMFPGIGRVAI